MNTPAQTVPSVLETLQARLGMSLDDVAEIVKRTELAGHKDIRWMLQREYGIKHGDAELLVNALFERGGMERGGYASPPPPA